MSLRLLWTSWRFTFKSLSLSRFFVLSAVVQPLIFATIAFYVGTRGRDEALDLVLGAAMIGAWTSTVLGSGSLLHWERWQRTLELLVGAPVPFVAVLVPTTLAAASLGLYSLAATLLWGKLVLGLPVQVDDPAMFALAVSASITSLGLLGLLLASAFILSRHATVLANVLNFPVWLVSGLLVPVSLLPGWVEPIGWPLAPTWGMRALREAALGGDALPAIAMCFGLGLVYLVLSAVVADAVLRLARRRATLALA